MTQRNNSPWLLFDYDDTLGGILHEGKVQGNEIAYWVAIDNFAALMEELGFDPQAAKDVQQEIDQELCTIHGFSWKPRFAESMVRTYKVLASRADVPVKERMAEIAYDVGMSVFEFRYMPLRGALFTLNALRPHWNIAVVTKGEDSEQRQKVADSGVGRFVDTVIPVGYKNQDDWNMVVSELNIPEADYSKTWAIGNSPKSDVNVPLRMGMNAIHVNQGGWAFEIEDYEKPHEGRSLIVVDHIDEVLNHLKWSD